LVVVPGVQTSWRENTAKATRRSLRNTSARGFTSLEVSVSLKRASTVSQDVERDVRSDDVYAFTQSRDGLPQELLEGVGTHIHEGRVCYRKFSCALPPSWSVCCSA
jgi:hypothetical protein